MLHHDPLGAGLRAAPSRPKAGLSILSLDGASDVYPIGEDLTDPRGRPRPPHGRLPFPFSAVIQGHGDPLLGEHLSDPTTADSLCRQTKDPSDHPCAALLGLQAVFLLDRFLISVRGIASDVFPSLHFGDQGRADLFGNVPGVHFIHHVTKGGHIVLPLRVIAVIDRHQPHAVIGKIHLGQLSRCQIISAQP